MNSQNNINAFADISRFGALRSEAGKDPSGAVAEVAKEFEALFIEMMLSSARKAAIKGGMFESHALELYREMFDTQAARVLAEKGALGFEQAISRFVGISDEKGIVAENAAKKSDEKGRTFVEFENRDVRVENGLALPARRADLPIPNASVASAVLEIDDSGQRNPEKSITDSAIRPQGISSSAVNGAGAGMQYHFSESIAPYANEAAEKLGTQASILIAQAALETGWGRHVIPAEGGGSSNNLFGIKATNRWQGASSQVDTLEFLGGRPINTKASFRSYPDIKSAFDDYVNFVADNPRYRGALENAGDADSYIKELAKAGYATDPKYAEKIISIKNRIEQMNSVANTRTDALNLGANSTQTELPN